MLPFARRREMTANVLFYNGFIVPLDGGRQVLQGGWLRVARGRILALGEGPPPPPRDGEEWVDLQGDILMPGMINTHCHMAMSLFRGLGDDEADRLERYIFPLEARHVTPAFVQLGSLHAAIELVEGGVTTVADMYFHEVEVARACKAVGLAAVLGETIMARPTPDAATPDIALEHLLELREFCIDEPLLIPSIAPHAPYSCGLALLERVAAEAGAARLPVQIHLAEVDREIAWAREVAGGSPVRALDRVGLLRRGLIAAHCILVDEADISLMAARDVRVSHNAGSNAKAGKGIAPILALRAAGVSVGLGSDGAMSGNTLDLFAQLPQVAKMQKLAARDRTVMRAWDVLEMATFTGARVLGLEKVTGCLRAGLRADVLRISRRAARLRPAHDIASLLVYSATAGDVEDVMIAGRWVVKQGRCVTVDREAALAEAEAYATFMRQSL
jgi:5-methylthioadenosine/S-adenosylhomocysteine deaminase